MVPAAEQRSMPPYTADPPAKKQSKWSAKEDALIIELRGSGMKWEDISKRLPGRSAISCRLHYQNYLERRSEWDEERKNKLARLYERLKPEIWAKVAEEMQVPWRAAEAMHWQLGEADMARRAGVTPFSLTAVTADASSSSAHQHPRRSPPGAPTQQPRALHQHHHDPQQWQHHQQQQQAHTYQGPLSGFPAAGSGGSLSPHYERSGGHLVDHALPPPPPLMHGDRYSPGEGGADQGIGVGYAREGPPPGPGLGPGPRSNHGPGRGSSDPANAMYHYQHVQQPPYHSGGPGLPPIQLGGGSPLQFQPQGRMLMPGSSGGDGGGSDSGALPSISEITTGVSHYSTSSAYLQGEERTGSAPPRQAASPASGLPSGGPTLPHLTYGGGSSGILPIGAMERSGPEAQGGGAGKRQASPSLDGRDARRRYMLRSPRHDGSSGLR